MKRLFQIFDRATGTRLAEFFDSKAKAKQARNNLQGENGPDIPWRFVVTPGPDHNHWRPEGGQRALGTA